MGQAPLVAAAPVLRARGFVKRYGGVSAVDGLDLEIGRGEIFGLIGPDGAGKSSFMKAAAGVLTYDGGTLEVFGENLATDEACERIKDRIGLMPQGLGQNLYADLSVEENIDFFARLRLVPEADLARRKRELLAATRLDQVTHRPMKQLSGGMKQKLGLVCTLIHEPAFIILDEPTTGVDPVSRRDFWAILARLLREKGITALVSTAYMDEASRFHRIALMFGGRVLSTGEPDALGQLSAGTLVSVQAADQVGALARLKTEFAQVDAMGPWVRVFVDDANAPAAEAQVRSALGDLPVAQQFSGAPELEDVFIALLRKRGLVDMKAAPTPARAHDAVDGQGAGGGMGATAGTDAGGEAHADANLAIDARALTRDFGAFRAADAVSFRVPAGEIFGLLGANGAGKSTVIKMLTGILKPSSGAGRVAGADMRSAGQAIKERIGYMSQAFSLYMDLSVRENIRLYAGIYGLDAERTETRMQWVLDMATLRGHEDRRAADLPMGMRQRLALGCALVHEPQVVFLDEPTSGVDPVGRRAFWDILFRLSREEGVAILVTTHYMSEAEHCDHLALMYAGRVVADDTPAGMKAAVEAEAGTLIEIACDGAQEAVGVLEAAGFAHAALFGNKLHCLSADVAADRARIEDLLAERGLVLHGIDTRPLSMEDVFVYRVSALEASERARKAAGQREAA